MLRILEKYEKKPFKLTRSGIYGGDQGSRWQLQSEKVDIDGSEINFSGSSGDNNAELSSYLVLLSLPNVKAKAFVISA